MSIEDIKDFAGKLEKASSPTNGISKSVFEGLKVDLLNRLILATPVITGNLRRGWTNGTDAENFARSVPTISTGSGYMATFTNTAEAYNTIGLKTPIKKYARFVNFGHRQHRGQYVPPLHRRLSAPRVEPVPFVDEAVEKFNENIDRAYANLSEYLKVLVK